MTLFTARRRQRAFSLIELLIVLAIIITVLVTLGLPAYQRASLRGQIASVTGSIQSAKTAVALYNAHSEGRPLPMTYTQGPATVPATGTWGGANRNLVVDLQTVLLNTRCLDAPITTALGVKSNPDLTVPVQWDPTTQTFLTAGDAAPTTFYRDTVTGLTAYARLVCVISAASGFATLSPSGTRLISFSLDGVTALPEGTRIICWEYARVSPNTAHEVAKSLYKGTVAAVGDGQFVGPVMYPATTADGTVPVFVYVTHY